MRILRVDPDGFEVLGGSGCANAPAGAPAGVACWPDSARPRVGGGMKRLPGADSGPAKPVGAGSDCSDVGLSTRGRALACGGLPAGGHGSSPTYRPGIADKSGLGWEGSGCTRTHPSNPDAGGCGCDRVRDLGSAWSLSASPNALRHIRQASLAGTLPGRAGGDQSGRFSGRHRGPASRERTRLGRVRSHHRGYRRRLTRPATRRTQDHRFFWARRWRYFLNTIIAPIADAVVTSIVPARRVVRALPA